jgi:hypothetical protein
VNIAGVLSSQHGPSITQPGKQPRKTDGKITHFKEGKSTISTGPFSIAFCMFTRGYSITQPGYDIHSSPCYVDGPWKLRMIFPAIETSIYVWDFPWLC